MWLDIALYVIALYFMGMLCIFIFVFAFSLLTTPMFGIDNPLASKFFSNKMFYVVSNFFVLYYMLHYSEQGGTIMKFFIMNWTIILGVLTFISTASILVLKELSRNADAQYFGVSPNLIKFSEKSFLIKGIEIMGVPLFCFVLPIVFIFFTRQYEQFNSIFRYIVNFVFVIAGYLILYHLYFEYLKKWYNIIINLVAFPLIVMLVVSYEQVFINEVDTWHLNFVVFAISFIILFIPFTVAYLFSKGSYKRDKKTLKFLIGINTDEQTGIIQREQKEIVIATSKDNVTYLVALRHDTTMWVMFECTFIDRNEKYICIDKSKHIIQEFFGFELERLEKYKIRFS